MQCSQAQAGYCRQEAEREADAPSQQDQAGTVYLAFRQPGQCAGDQHCLGLTRAVKTLHGQLRWILDQDPCAPVHQSGGAAAPGESGLVKQLPLGVEPVQADAAAGALLQ